MRGSFLGLLVAAVIIFIGSHLPLAVASGCPLDLGWTNFSLAASVCSNENERAKCCRQINALIAVSIARYAISGGKLGVPSNFSEICLQSITETLKLHGIPSNATAFCGLGTKILVNYPCEGRQTVADMLQSPNFNNVSDNCKPPLSSENSCRRCVNSGIIFLHHLSGVRDNVTLSMCRNAAFVTLVNQEDSATIIEVAGCFFSVQGLILPPSAPESSPNPSSTETSAQHVNSEERHQSYHLRLIPSIFIGITAIAVLLLAAMLLLIRRKNRELKSSKASTTVRKLPEGPPPMFRRFSYRETKKATRNFTTEIGNGKFGTVYRGEFSSGAVAVKRVQGFLEREELELLGRLHHRHLVSLKGFCATRHQRFLMYEFMENGSLKDHLHSSGRMLSWRTRIQIAVDVANALEYLHFYCDPPLCHGDIKPGNILLDGNFRAKVADFALASASRGCEEVRGTPGYVDPEYVLTAQLTEKSDVYSYGVLLLELVRESPPPDPADPAAVDSFEAELRTIAAVAEWCTRSDAKSRPSIKQVLVELYEGLDPVHRDFAGAVEDGGAAAVPRRSDVTPHSGLQSSSSTSRSYCSRSFLLESGSPQSPQHGFSL